MISWTFRPKSPPEALTLSMTISTPGCSNAAKPAKGPLLANKRPILIGSVEAGEVGGGALVVVAGGGALVVDAGGGALVVDAGGGAPVVLGGGAGALVVGLAG